MTAEKKAYPLRINADVLDAVQRWAEAELRSANAQAELLLREALARRGIKLAPPQGRVAAARKDPESGS